MLNDFGHSIFHRDWVEVEAEVQECKPLRQRAYPSRSLGSVVAFSAYWVTFNYVVNGKTYGGITFSPDKIEVQDKFAIRYNPKRPEENNTFDSETDWVPVFTKCLGIIMGLFILYFFLKEHYLPN
jgi:hypothetical protein